MDLNDKNVGDVVLELEKLSHVGSIAQNLTTRCRYRCAIRDSYSEIDPLEELVMYALKLYFKPLYDLIKKKRD